MAAGPRQSAVDAAEEERRAADDHARLDAELRAREAPNEVDSAERELEDARNHARSLQAEWWSAKTTVDEQIRAFNENRKMEHASAPDHLAVPAGDRLPLIAEEPESLPHDHHAVPTPQENSLADFLAPPRTAEAEGR